eukprot:g2337.t1
MPLYRQFEENMESKKKRDRNRRRPKSAINSSTHDRSWYFANVVPVGQQAAVRSSTKINGQNSINDQLQEDIAFVSRIPTPYKSEYSGRTLFTKHPQKTKKDVKSSRPKSALPGLSHYRKSKQQSVYDSEVDIKNAKQRFTTGGRGRLQQRTRAQSASLSRRRHQGSSSGQRKRMRPHTASTGRLGYEPQEDLEYISKYRHQWKKGGTKDLWKRKDRIFKNSQKTRPKSAYLHKTRGSGKRTSSKTRPNSALPKYKITRTSFESKQAADLLEKMPSDEIKCVESQTHSQHQRQSKTQESVSTPMSFSIGKSYKYQSDIRRYDKHFPPASHSSKRGGTGYIHGVLVIPHSAIKSVGVIVPRYANIVETNSAVNIGCRMTILTDGTKFRELIRIVEAATDGNFSFMPAGKFKESGAKPLGNIVLYQQTMANQNDNVDGSEEEQKSRSTGSASKPDESFCNVVVSDASYWGPPRDDENDNVQAKGEQETLVNDTKMSVTISPLKKAQKHLQEKRDRKGAVHQEAQKRQNRTILLRRVIAKHANDNMKVSLRRAGATFITLAGEIDEKKKNAGKVTKPEYINETVDQIFARDLCASAQRGEMKEVQRLLDEEAGFLNMESPDVTCTVNSQTLSGETALMAAARYLQFEMVLFLLAKGADKTITMPVKVKSKGHDFDTDDEIVEERIEKLTAEGICRRVDTPKKRLRRMTVVVLQTNSIFDAAKSGQLDRVRFLVETKEVDCNVTNRYGTTPLHYAVMNDHYEIVAYLCLKGADRNAANNLDQTPWDLVKSIAVRKAMEAADIQHQEELAEEKKRREEEEYQDHLVYLEEKNQRQYKRMTSASLGNAGVPTSLKHSRYMFSKTGSQNSFSIAAKYANTTVSPNKDYVDTRWNETKKMSRLRHARRFGQGNAENFHLATWPSIDHAKYEHWLRSFVG